MVIGINALMFSAQFFEDDGTPKEENKDESKQDKKNDTATNEISGFAMFLTILSSLAISIGLFFVLPNVIAGLIVPNSNTEKDNTVISGEVISSVSADAIEVVDNVLSGEKAKTSSIKSGFIAPNSIKESSNNEVEVKGNRNDVAYNIVESIVKIVIFLGYLILVSQMKDIRRVFEYHGAEHKSIFCYENGEELTVENVKKYKRFHPRCGTSFLLFVVIISIVIYSIVGRHPNMLMNVLIRIALLPLIAGVSYEIIRFAGKHSDNKFISWLNQPGMWLQRLTTREPDDSQIECAINSLKAVIPEDEKADQW